MTDKPRPRLNSSRRGHQPETPVGTTPPRPWSEDKDRTLFVVDDETFDAINETLDNHPAPKFRGIITHVRFLPDEMRAVRKAAREAGITTAEYIRRTTRASLD